MHGSNSAHVGATSNRAWKQQTVWGGGWGTGVAFSSSYCNAQASRGFGGARPPYSSYAAAVAEPAPSPRTVSLTTYIYICASPSASQHAPLVTASPCEGARFYGVVIIWAIMKVMPRVLLMLRVGGAGVLTRIYGAWASTAARGVMGSKLNNSTSNRQSSTCLFCLARRTTSAMCRGRRAGNTTTTCCHSRTQPSCSQSQHAGVEHVS